MAKAEYVTPEVDRDVVLTLTGLEARKLRWALGSITGGTPVTGVWQALVDLGVPKSNSFGEPTQ